jgi:ABC-2 type transport system permease protein
MLKIAIKDLKLFLSDKRLVIVTFVVPIALISLFSLAFGGGGSRTSQPTRLVIADEDQTAQSKEVIAKLDSSKIFTIIIVPVDQVESLVKKGDESSVLVLHKGLKDSLEAGKTAPIELRYDAARTPELGMLKGALIGRLMEITGTRSMEKKAIQNFEAQNPGMDEVTRKHIREDISKNFSGSVSGDLQKSMLKSTPVIAEKENSPGLVQAVAGTAIMMLLFAVVSMGASLLDEKQEGTLKKLLYSPLSPNSVLFGKMLYANSISIVQLTVMFLFSGIVFGLNLGQNIPGLVIMILVTAFACSSFGTFVASFAKSRQQVQGLATLIIMIMSGIGGSMIPLFLMPAWMQKIAVFSVNYWGIQGFYDIFWRQLPVTDPTFLTRVAILLVMGLVLNIISLQLFRKNVLSLA